MGESKIPLSVRQHLNKDNLCSEGGAIVFSNYVIIVNPFVTNTFQKNICPKRTPLII